MCKRLSIGGGMVLNVKTGIAIAAIAAIGYVAFKSRGSITQFSSSTFDSSVFTDRAKTQAASITNPIFNARLDRQISPIQAEISKAQSFIAETNKQLLPPCNRNNSNYPCESFAGLDRSAADYFAGKTSSVKSQSLAAANAVFARVAKRRNQEQAVKNAQAFINEQQKKIALINSERKGL